MRRLNYFHEYILYVGYFPFTQSLLTFFVYYKRSHTSIMLSSSEFKFCGNENYTYAENIGNLLQ